MLIPRLGVRIRSLLGAAIGIILFIHVRYQITGSPKLFLERSIL
uniref:Uncharacterized protein n=1 Tax=Arundo donax TaxID=35708 RepID=A0A0A9EHL0_ARUDO